jgi:hypothetical protein
VKPDDLPDDHPVKAVPAPPLVRGSMGAMDFIGDETTARGFFRAYDDTGALVWFYGPVDHLLVRHVGANLLDNADRLELADRERKRRARLN